MATTIAGERHNLAVTFRPYEVPLGHGFDVARFAENKRPAVNGVSVSLERTEVSISLYSQKEVEARVSYFASGKL